MFNQLRVNSPIYLFHKTLTPILETGYVQSIIGPKLKYAVPSNLQQTQEYVVDLQVKVNDNVINYKNLPAQQEVYEFYEGTEPIIISDNKQAMNQEVLNHKQRSIDTINSLDSHKKAVTICDSIIKDLNPEFAEKQQQKQDFDSLKELVQLLTQNMKLLVDTNLKLVERFKEKET